MEAAETVPRLDQVFLAKSIDTEHKDLINDVSFDFYGKRMATCSSDQTVKIWNLDENKTWVCSSSWKTHNAPVWKVTWAHPEFGQVIATCSFDRTVSIWEESFIEQPTQTERIWVHNANLVDSRTSVKDIKFAPKHLGLQLASCSSNGIIRIYEAPDVMNLMHWSLQYQIHCKIACSCISWNPSCYRYCAPMIAVGSDDETSSGGGKVFIYELNDSSRDWVKIQTIMSITDAVNDISFAPSLGRKFHKLAVASKELNIFDLKPLNEEKPTNTGSTLLSVNQVAKFTEHNCKVVNVAWNMFGSVLLSSGDDGQILIWMANYLNIWRKVGELKKGAANLNDFSNIVHDKTESPTHINEMNNRINFRRFTKGRGPPIERPLEPKYVGAYY